MTVSDSSTSLTASYVYGNYIDEVLTMRRGSSDYYYHADDQHNVVKLTDSNGDVVESYDYGDYGLPEFFDATGTLSTANTSSVGNPYLFTGRRWDEELGYYYYRNRYMDPVLGRFVSRDPIGLWGDAANLGNGYTYAASNPWSLVDPFGLEAGGNQSWGAWLDGIQLALGAAGLTPGVGIVPDAASLVISVLRLDVTGAIIDAGSMIPVAGQFVRGSEFAAKAGKQILKHSDEVADVVKVGDDLVDGAKATTHADEISVIANAPNESVGTGRIYEAGDILPSGRTAGTGPGTPRSGQGPDVPDMIHVTPQGVALLPDAKYSIPDSYADNPYRPGSYGEVVDGKFVERLRIDPATPTGKSGPEYSHYHLNGGREHFSPKRSDSDPGFR